MNKSDAGVTRRTTRGHRVRAGAVPSASLHFLTGQTAEANALVCEFHYSRRPPSNVQLVGTFHEAGGLFGDQGPAVAACFFSIPPTRWAESVLELSRLVRRDGERPPLSRLISLCMKQLRLTDWDLVVSFADKTQGHRGGVYRAAGWNYSGTREKRQDGLIVNGEFIPGRSCNSLYGTRSQKKLSAMFPDKEITPHWDMGKHIFWKALGRRGMKKAKRLGLS